MQSAAENKCRKKKIQRNQRCLTSLCYETLVKCLISNFWAWFLASVPCGDGNSSWHHPCVSGHLSCCSVGDGAELQWGKVTWQRSIGRLVAGMATVSGLWTLSWNWSFFKKIKLSLACVWEMWPLVGSASGHEAALVVEASLQTCPGPFCTPKAHLLCKDP